MGIKRSLVFHKNISFGSFALWAQLFAEGNENDIDHVWDPDLWGNCLSLAFTSDTGF